MIKEETIAHLFMILLILMGCLMFNSLLAIVIESTKEHDWFTPAEVVQPDANQIGSEPQWDTEAYETVFGPNENTNRTH